MIIKIDIPSIYLVEAKGDYIQVKTEDKNYTVHSTLKKIEILTLIFKKDNLLKTELKGIIIGHFTTDEFLIYCTNKTEFNKRILAMIHQRITSVIDSL